MARLLLAHSTLEILPWCVFMQSVFGSGCLAETHRLTIPILLFGNQSAADRLRCILP
jgi:hypothetical protein